MLQSRGGKPAHARSKGGPPLDKNFLFLAHKKQAKFA